MWSPPAYGQYASSLVVGVVSRVAAILQIVRSKDSKNSSWAPTLQSAFQSRIPLITAIGPTFCLPLSSDNVTATALIRSTCGLWESQRRIHFLKSADSVRHHLRRERKSGASVAPWPPSEYPSRGGRQAGGGAPP